MREVDLNIYRPVASFTDATTDALLRQLQNVGVNSREVYHRADQKSRASILTSSDLEVFFSDRGIPLDSINFDALVNHVTASLPQTVSSPLEIPTYPHAWHKIGRKPLHFFTVAANNPVVRNERTAAQLLVQDFLHIDSDSLAPEWQQYDYKTEAGILKTGDASAAGFIDMILENMPGVLPPTTALGPIAVKNGMVTEQLAGG